jgi:peptidoglycan-associated lipoprotein
MKLNKIRFLENFVMMSFPFALAVGCTSTAEQSSRSSFPDDITIIQEYPANSKHNQWISQNESEDVYENSKSQASVPASGDFGADYENENNLGEDMYLKTANSKTGLFVEPNSNPRVSEKTVSSINDNELLKVNVPQAAPHTMQSPAQDIIYFEVNKHAISASDFDILKQHASYLQNNANLVLYVDGFSDNRGPANLNYQLSKKRAQQVADLLIRYGAPESRIKVNGYGESFPQIHVSDWDANRRVELEYVTIDSSDELIAAMK